MDYLYYAIYHPFGMYYPPDVEGEYEVDEKTKTQRHLMNKQIKNTTNFKLTKVETNKLLQSMKNSLQKQEGINYKTDGFSDNFENKITTKNRRQKRYDRKMEYKKMKRQSSIQSSK